MSVRRARGIGRIEPRLHAWTAALVVAASCVPVTPTAKEPAAEASPAPPLPTGPVTFELESVDEHSVSAPALRGKPVVLAFVVTDTLAGQAEATIVSGLAQRMPDAARYVVVAVEPEERHELVYGFVRFFTDKTHAPLLGAMATKEMLDGQGPFGDVRGLTVIVLDGGGNMAFRKAGVVQANAIVEVLRALTM